jgi:hypothetical protein
LSLMRLTQGGRSHRVDVRLRPRAGQILLELARLDCKAAPSVTLSLEEAAELLRALQSARDEAFRRAKVESKQARANAELAQVVDRVAHAIGHGGGA